MVDVLALTSYSALPFVHISEVMSMNPEFDGTTAEKNAMTATATSVLNLLLGIWFFISPWIFGASDRPNAWNAWILGAVIAILAALRLSNPVALRPLSSLNMLIGIWVFFSPWIFGYVPNTGRMVNSLFVGALVFLFSIAAANAQARMPIA